MPKTARKPVAMLIIGERTTVSFASLNETPGAHRLQEQDADGTPLLNDEDGTKVGALYLRKSAFGDVMPEGAQFEVTIKRVK